MRNSLKKIEPSAGCLLGGFLFFTLAFVVACGGVSGSSVEDDQIFESDSFRSLRLGQSASSDRRVATSAAINNRESLIVLNSEEGSSDIVHVLYTSADNEVARITVDSSDRPVTAETENALATFSNYTDTTVDVSILADGVQFPATTVALDPAVLGLLTRTRFPTRFAREGDSIENEILRQLLEGALIATRTFGCAGNAAAAASGASSAFTGFTNATCNSVLLDTVAAVIEEDDQEISERIVEDIVEVDSCNFELPGWTDNFGNAQGCASGVSDDLVSEVIQDTPDFTTAVEEGSDGIESGSSTSSSGVSSGDGGPGGDVGSSSSSTSSSSSSASSSSTSSSSTSSSSTTSSTSSSSTSSTGSSSGQPPDPPPPPGPPGGPIQA